MPLIICVKFKNIKTNSILQHNLMFLKDLYVNYGTFINKLLFSVFVIHVHC